MTTPTPTPGADVCPDCARLRAENEALDKRCDELAAGVDGYEKQAAKYRAIAAENEALRAGRAATGEREAGRAEGLEEAAREAERERDACDIKGAQDHRGGNREMWRAWAYKSDTARVIAARIRALIPAQPKANEALDALEAVVRICNNDDYNHPAYVAARKVLIDAGRLPAKEDK